MHELISIKLLTHYSPQDCLKAPTCDCFTGLPALDATCDFEDANTAAKAAKKKCNSPDEPGSFGDCTTAQKFAAGKVSGWAVGGNSVSVVFYRIELSIALAFDDGLN